MKGVKSTQRRRGFSVVEMMAVTGILAVLFALGSGVYRSARLAARVALAESNLKQVGVALELYYRRYGAFPAQGSDLAAALKGFVKDERVFANPLAEERVAGETITLMYREPSLDEADKAGQYVTAMFAEDGQTVVVLETGDRVEQRSDLRFDPNHVIPLLIALTGEQQIRGELNLNPRNNWDCEFEMRKPDGTVITRDDLLGSKGELTYEGKALWIRVNPKGNGNQNSLTLDGESYSVRNGVLYTLDGGRMGVRLYNSGRNGEAMGKWWIAIHASGTAIQGVRGNK